MLVCNRCQILWIKKNYAAVKTTPHINKKKKASLIPSTVKLLADRKRPSQRGPIEYQKEKRSHKETGVQAQTSKSTTRHKKLQS
jgi:hypothetical protein